MALLKFLEVSDLGLYAWKPDFPDVEMLCWTGEHFLELLSSLKALDPFLFSNGLANHVSKGLIEELRSLVEEDTVGANNTVVCLIHTEFYLLVDPEANSNFAFVDENDLIYHL